MDDLKLYQYSDSYTIIEFHKHKVYWAYKGLDLEVAHLSPSGVYLTHRCSGVQFVTPQKIRFNILV